MAASEDLALSAALFKSAADATAMKLVRLGRRPAESVAAAEWDRCDTLLKDKLSELTNLSSNISALVVSNSLHDVWPKLDRLSEVTSSAQQHIARVSDLSEAMVKVALVIDFGLAVVALSASPNIGAARDVYDTFRKVRDQKEVSV